MTRTDITTGLYVRNVPLTSAQKALKGFEAFRYGLSDDLYHPSGPPRVELPAENLSAEDQVLSYAVNCENTRYGDVRPVFGRRERGYVDFLPNGTGEIVTGAYWSSEVRLWAENDEVKMLFTSSLLLVDGLRDVRTNRRTLDWYFESTILRFF